MVAAHARVLQQQPRKRILPCHHVLRLHDATLCRR
jgi:hypothetical protein